MTYKLKVSSKNQVTLPVNLLEEIHLKNKNQPRNLVISKNLSGKYEIIDPLEVLDSLTNFKNQSRRNLSDEQIEKDIQTAKNKYYSNNSKKYS